jgi:hypothetical protein
MKLHVPTRKRRGVPEKHLDVDVVITNQVATLELCKLDKTGIKRFNARTSNIEFELVAGLAYAKWKTYEDRLSCKADQKANTEKRTSGENRWSDIQKCKSSIMAGEVMPWPTVVHPSLTSLDGLEVIDGIRRLVAHVEAKESPILVAVIRRKPNLNPDQAALDSHR